LQNKILTQLKMGDTSKGVTTTHWPAKQCTKKEDNVPVGTVRVSYKKKI
jgi:hypothetical protein